MNANELWAGHDYAYAPQGTGRGRDWIPGCRRVKIIGVMKVESPRSNYDYYERRRVKRESLAEVYLLEDDGTFKTDYNGDNVEKQIRARDVFMRWSEYEIEKTRRDSEKKKREEEREAREAAKIQRRVDIIDGLEAKGLNRLVITVSEHSGVYIPLHEAERWLGIGNIQESERGSGESTSTSA